MPGLVPVNVIGKSGSLCKCTLGPHHLEGLGDEDSEHPDPEEDEQRRSETDGGCDPLCHPALPPGALTAA